MEGKRRGRVFSDPDPLSCIRRSMLYACGLTYEEIKRPLVAVSESLRRFAGPARVFNSEEEALVGLGESTYIVTDGRFSGYSEGPSIGYLSPEAAAGGTIALVEDTVYRI